MKDAVPSRTPHPMLQRHVMSYAELRIHQRWAKTMCDTEPALILTCFDQLEILRKAWGLDDINIDTHRNILFCEQPPLVWRIAHPYHIVMPDLHTYWNNNHWVLVPHPSIVKTIVDAYSGGSPPSPKSPITDVRFMLLSGRR
jgi:hypothetical protein